MIHLPQFKHIAVDKIQPVLSKILAENLNSIEQNDLSDPIGLLEMLDNQLQLFWSPIAHLHAVRSTSALRKTYQACLPLLSQYHTALAHHEKLYQAMLVQKNKRKNKIETRIATLHLQAFRLSGIHLAPNKKQRYAEIEKKLCQLQARFSENVLLATEAFVYQATPSDLKGLPQQVIPADYRLNLQYPVYASIQKYAENRALREKFYQAYVTRASEYGQPEQDNTQIMQEILSLRHETASLLGFQNYATLSLQTKMLKKPKQVFDFLQDLLAHAKPMATQELARLTDFAGFALQPWDIAFYAEKLNRAQYGIDQEMFRPYFAVETVLSGLFSLVKQLYSIHIQQRENVDVWHKTVSCYEIYTVAHDRLQLLGIFYLDLYARRSKREGAWMDEYCSRYAQPNGEIQLPVAYINCNFLANTGLTHDEVMTLFHEVGHGLHHLLTTIDRISIAGIRGVEWDAVELPSQFMENFCWQKAVLMLISDQTLPEDLCDKLLASRYFHAGLHLVRQIEFALLDFYLHTRKPDTEKFVMQVFQAVHAQTAVISTPDYSRFLHTFSHIFDGGYAAGYYSYLWAEVLSSDVFAIFEQTGILNPRMGKKFLKKLLSQGGSRPMSSLFKCLMGRNPDKTAFLKNWGLLNVGESNINH